MESGTIADAQISASSKYNSNLAPSQGRLNLPSKAWAASSSNLNEWLQIDLIGQDATVTRVATQGSPSSNEWVKVYKLQYNKDGVNFEFYTEQGQSANKVK